MKHVWIYSPYLAFALALWLICGQARAGFPDYDRALWQDCLATWHRIQARKGASWNSETGWAHEETCMPLVYQYEQRRTKRTREKRRAAAETEEDAS